MSAHHARERAIRAVDGARWPAPRGHRGVDIVRAIENAGLDIVERELECTCGFVASIGGRDPECPKHGQDADRPIRRER